MVKLGDYPMMRCVQCDREYPEPQGFCHQCGEALLPTAAPAERPPARERTLDSSSQLRARAISRRRAPRRSQSLLFASIVVLGAFAGLALVWRQVWLPSLPRITVSLSRESAQQSPAASNPPPQVATAPAAPAPPPPTSEPERPSVTPTPTPTPASAVSAPVTPRAPEPVAAAPAPAPPKRTPEPTPSKVAAAPESAPTPSRVASRPEPAAAPPPADRPAPPKLLSARTDPGTSLPTSGTRVIALVPVGPAIGARGQLLWEPMGGGTLVVSGLPQPPAGRTYQLWLGSINLGNRVSAGLLAVDSQGTGTLRVAPPRATWSPDIFGITMERQGGAREPSDDLVLVGELSKTTSSAPPATAMATTPSGSAAAGASERATTPALPSADTSPAGASPSMTASIPPPGTAARGSEGQLVRVFSASAERSFTVAQSVLRSLGWDIDEANQSTGVIRTEPRNVTFKDFVVYGEGTRHVLDVVVRQVSGSETSISVKRRVFAEQRIFWTKERKDLPASESPVEQTVLDAISRLL
jgi:hypothetical protein